MNMEHTGQIPSSVCRTS